MIAELLALIGMGPNPIDLPSLAELTPCPLIAGSSALVMHYLLLAFRQACRSAIRMRQVIRQISN